MNTNVLNLFNKTSSNGFLNISLGLHLIGYTLIKDSFKNLTLSGDILFKGPVHLYHGMKDEDVPYSISIKILEKIKGSQNVSLLLDKEAGHRLSEENQLDMIIDIIKKTLKEI